MRNIITAAAIAALLTVAGCSTNRASTGMQTQSDEQSASVSVRIVPASTDQVAGYEAVTDEDGQTFYVGTKPIVTERDIVAARREVDRRNRESIVVKLSDEGAKRLHEFTSTHIAEHLAILLDGKLTSVVKIQSEVSRTAVISGSFTQERAEEIAKALNGQ